MNETTDTELTHRLTQHDEAAFEILFRRYASYLYGVAIQYVKDPILAEDTIQDVFLNVWMHRTHLDKTKSIKAYLATATRNQVLNQLHDEKRAILRHITHQQSQPDADTSTEESILLNEYGIVVASGLSQLSDQRRRVFMLRSEAGLTNEEVAAQLQISINTVKVHYYQACRFLRSYLRQHAGIEAMLLFMATFL